MKPFFITEQFIEEALNAELQAIEMEKIVPKQAEDGKESSNEYRMSKRAALRVDFIETAEELRLYTDAIYNAVIWGQNIK